MWSEVIDDVSEAELRQILGLEDDDRLDIFHGRINVCDGAWFADGGRWRFRRYVQRDN